MQSVPRSSCADRLSGCCSNDSEPSGREWGISSLLYFVCLFICSFVCLFISFCLFVCLFICLIVVFPQQFVPFLDFFLLYFFLLSSIFVFSSNAFLSFFSFVSFVLLSHYLCLCSISPCIETAVLSNAGRLLCVLFRQGCTCWGNYSGRSIVEDEDDTGGKTRVGVRSESARELDFGVYFCAALLVFTYFLLVFICSFVCLGCKRLGWGSLACLSCLLIHVYGR